MNQYPSPESGFTKKADAVLIDRPSSSSLMKEVDQSQTDLPVFVDDSANDDTGHIQANSVV